MSNLKLNRKQLKETESVKYMPILINCAMKSCSSSHDLENVSHPTFSSSNHACSGHITARDPTTHELQLALSEEMTTIAVKYLSMM
jgi:hypothetical protein